MRRRSSLTGRALRLITAFYLESRDFNGLPYDDLVDGLEATDEQVTTAVRSLIRSSDVSAVFGDIHPNPHIRALPDEPIESQRQQLASTARHRACLYPTESSLATVVPPTLHLDRPFTRRLALGEPQLAYAPFDLAVLEFYRNDPRYYYSVSDADGQICVHDDYFESPEMPERDQVLLQTFGFCYNSKLERAVAVFLRYLSDLSPEHQQLWQSRILTGEYHIHPDYWRASMGHWPKGVSIFQAVLAEMKLINEMATAMMRPALFRSDFNDSRPIEFTFLIRPTQKEFDSFVQTLDKMLSDNINVEFFRGEVDAEVQEERTDGSLVLRPKGTINMLKEWIDSNFSTSSPTYPAMVQTLKRVRKLRSKPAHAIRVNVFDQLLVEQQRELIIDVFRAVRTIRQILANWPETAGCEVPRFLTGELEIWTL